MAKAEQTIVLTTTEARALRADVAEFWRDALEVAKSKLAVIREVGNDTRHVTDNVDDDDSQLSDLEQLELLAKTARIISDQIRRDAPTEHLIERKVGDDKPNVEKPKPSLKGVKLRIAN